MPEGGELYIKTMNISHEQIRKRNYKIKAGDYIMLVIADNGSGMENKVRRRIFEVTGLTASVGVAHNKFLAKLASDVRKPDGLTVIPEGRIQAILDPLPVRKVWGVGPAAAETPDEETVDEPAAA